MATHLQKIYSDIAHHYEIVNHLFTMGLDIVWRGLATRIIKRLGLNGLWLDVCSGTGEMAGLLHNIAENGTQIIAADFSPEMLRESKKKDFAGAIDYALADAQHLPFKDNSLDLITISFATRNLNKTRGQLAETFSEFRRVVNSCAKVGHFWTSRDMNMNTTDYITTLRLDMKTEMSLDQLCPVPLPGGLRTACPTWSN